MSARTRASKLVVGLTPLQAEVLRAAVEFVLTADECGRALGFTARTLDRLRSADVALDRALRDAR